MSIDPNKSIRTNAKSREAAEEATRRIAADPIVASLVKARDSITEAYAHAINARHAMPSGPDYAKASAVCDHMTASRDVLDRLLKARGYQP